MCKGELTEMKITMKVSLHKKKKRERKLSKRLIMKGKEGQCCFHVLRYVKDNKES